MNRLSTAIVTLFAAMTITGCAHLDDGSEIEPAVGPGSTLSTADLDVPANMELIYVEDAPDGVCGCTTKDCMRDWVIDNLGCGVCLDAVCEDGTSAGGCFACPEETPAIGAPRPQGTSIVMQ